MKKIVKRMLSVLLSLAMVFSALSGFATPLSEMLSITANAYTSKTKAEAMNWVRSQVGVSIDFDGYYGAQCVDLIKAYYQYLGVAPVSGNAIDYTNDNGVDRCPDGWQRIAGAQPQEGDILIYTGGTGNLGHVAIYESDYVTYHQNIILKSGESPRQYVVKYTGAYNGFSTPYWGVIRPDFKSEHTHNYTSTVTKQPTCTGTGTKTFKCSCGVTYTETIKAKGHSYKTTVVAPTETDKGYTLHKCSVCSYNYKDNYIDPPTYKDGWYYCDVLPSGITTDKYTVQYKHYYEKIQEKSPGTGWTNAGVAKTEWKNSGNQYISYFDLETSNSRVLVKSIYFHFCGPNTGKSVHYGMEGNYVHWDSVDPSKVSAEFAEYDADSGYPVYLLSWSDGSRVWCQSGVTCDGSNGSHGQRGLAWYKENTYQDRVKVTTYKFTKETDYIAKKDTTATTITYRYQPNHTHTVVTDKAIAATCTTAGKTAGSHCSTCNAVITAQTTIPATGHTTVTDKAVAATCTTAGKTEGSHCSKCNAVIKAQTTIPATGHKWSEWIIAIEPTTITDGIKTRVCKNCNTMQNQSIPMLESTTSEVKSVDLGEDNIAINYHNGYKFNPNVVTEGNIDYNVEFSSSNSKIVSVDENGNIYGNKKGSAVITCTVTDANGKVATDTCNVNVTFNFGQWLLYIICFGWIWM